MRKTSLFVTAFLSVSLALSFFSCTKNVSSSLNDQLIETPYTLYFTDSSGVVYHTNDGKNITVVAPADGSPARSLITSNSNILLVKPYLGLPGANVPYCYWSNTNGTNFNHSFDFVQSLQSLATTPVIDAYGNPVELNQSLMIAPKDWGHVYITSNSPDGSNYFGIYWNTSDGAPTDWHPEIYYDTVEVTNPHNFEATSFTQIKSGTTFAYDGLHQRIFKRVLPDANHPWQEVFATGTFVLPDNTTAFFSAGHLNNQLIFIDQKGNQGAYYSDDIGATWHQYGGLPASTPLLCINSPFEQVCLVGTDKRGLYMFNSNTSRFEDVGGGLPQGLSVHNIAGKENILKNGTHVQYIYLATSQGIYQSSDMGHNWVRTIAGNFVTIY